MDKIIANEYRDKTRFYIQRHIQETLLEGDARNELIKLYNSVTAENAHHVYDMVKKIYGEAVAARFFDNLGFCKPVLLIGGGLTAMGYIGTNKYEKHDDSYYYFDWAQTIGVCMLATSVGILLS